jgi:hypothetical protein
MLLWREPRHGAALFVGGSVEDDPTLGAEQPGPARGIAGLVVGR